MFLVGRTQAKLDAVASEIRATGGSVDAGVVDALDEQAVDQHAQRVVSEAGSIDVSFNLISRRDAQGTLLINVTAEPGGR